MKKLSFVKMHWTWNDFIVLYKKDIDKLSIKITWDFIRKICNRNFWIWSDWLLIVSESTKADFKYNMYNPDWTEAEMCGNGIRCYMKYLLDNNITTKTDLDVETLIWNLNLKYENKLFRVDMWKPWKIKWFSFDNKELWERFALKSSWRDFVFLPVSMWNPHACIFLQKDDLDNFDLEKYWKPIENNTDIFPNRTNVEFMKVVWEKEIDLRVWERWAWETLSCWTWVCAWVVAGILSGRLRKNVFIKVNVKWWVLFVKWSWSKKDSVILKWEAETTFEWLYYIY